VGEEKGEERRGEGRRKNEEGRKGGREKEEGGANFYLLLLPSTFYLLPSSSYLEYHFRLTATEPRSPL
jgi:hypothetical protein